MSCRELSDFNVNTILYSGSALSNAFYGKILRNQAVDSLLLHEIGERIEFFPRGTRIQKWIQAGIENPKETVQNTVLSPERVTRLKGPSNTDLFNMMAIGCLVPFALTASSYLVIMATSIALISSILIYPKFAKTVETSRCNYRGIDLIKQSLTYLTDPDQAGKYLKDSKKLLDFEKFRLRCFEQALEYQELKDQGLEYQEFLKKENVFDENAELDKEALLIKKDASITARDNIINEINGLEKSNKFFEKNSDLVTRVTNAFLEINEAAKNKMEACEGFIFSFLGNVILTRCVFSLIKVVVNPNNYRIMGAGLTAIVGGIGIAITFAAIGTFIMSVQNALIIIAHRNDEAKKQSLLASIKEEQKTILLSY